MPSLRMFLVLCLALIPIAAPGLDQERPMVVLETDIGRIRIEIFAQEAPITSRNFLRYVDEGRFKGASFYRVVHLSNQPDNEVKIEVIQGGLGFETSPNALPPIDHESTDRTGILHEDGVLSMARNEPGSASSEFFITIGPQPELDFAGRRNPDGQGFAAFGRVVSGMEVVRKIQTLPSSSQMLGEQVIIRSVYRAK